MDHANSVNDAADAQQHPLSKKAAAQQTAASFRNPRRRRRNDSSEVIRHPRKRNKVTDDTFRPLEGSPLANGVNGVNGSAAPVHGNGHQRNGSKDMVVREKRNGSGPWRGARVESGTLLTKNSKYTVRLLPALPERLRNNRDLLNFRPFFRSTSSHHAVAITEDQVLIWDYNFSGAIPPSRVINLNYPIKPSDPLPLGSLVTTTNSNILGLVLIYPATGKVSFWDNVDSAESLKLFHSGRQGVEGTIKLMGGERVEEIIDAEHAGFVILTSGGRVGQLTLRDTQGRPNVSSIFLGNGQSKGYGLGDWYQMFRIGWRNSVCAVRCRPSTIKGRMDVLALTVEGTFKSWDLSWTGQHGFFGDINSAAGVRDALSNSGMAEMLQKSTLKFLDFSFFSAAAGQSYNESGNSMRVLALVCVEQPTHSNLVLVCMTLVDSSCNPTAVIPIDVYEPSPHSESRFRLVTTQFENTVFIVHDTALVTISMPSSFESGPQVQTTSTPACFQDVVYFNSKKGASIMASAVETPTYTPRHGTANILLFTKHAGVVRVACQESSEGNVTAKSKIEQAIYFGTHPDNILDFTKLSGFGFTSENVEDAVVKISAEVLKSDSEHIPAQPGAMEDHLNARMKILEDIKHYTMRFYPNVSRATKWRLLWDAEKMAAALAVWKYYEEFKGKHPHRVTFLERVIDLALERYKDDQKGETENLDDVRIWFSKELNRLEKLFPYACKTLVSLWKDGQHNASQFTTQFQESNNICINALETAFTFRRENATRYGLDDEDFDNGILVSRYEKLPEFWTSRASTTTSLSMLVTRSQKFIRVIFENGPEDQEDANQHKEVAARMDSLVRLSCQSHVERYRWLLAQDDPELKKSGRAIMAEFDKIRGDQLVGLFDIGQGHSAMKLAEELNDVPSLVKICLLEIDVHRLGHLQASTTDPKIKSSRRHPGTRPLEEGKAEGLVHILVRSYFRKFGDAFAVPFFEAQIEGSHRLGDFLDANLGLQEQKTCYLRQNHDAKGKLAWINEVLAEKDFVRAGETLTKSVAPRELNSWCKNVELSIAKLALMSEYDKGQKQRNIKGEQKDSSASDAPYLITSGSINGEMAVTGQFSPNKHADQNITILLDRTESELEIMAIQQALERTVQPVVHAALDGEAAVLELMRTCGQHVSSKRRNILGEILKHGFSQLVEHKALAPELLVDVLTLIDGGDNRENGDAVFVPPPSGAMRTEPRDVTGREFWLALKVVDQAIQSEERAEELRRLVWKRAVVRDDWHKVGDTKDRTDREVQASLKGTEAFKLMKEIAKEGLLSNVPETTTPATALALSTKQPKAAVFPALESLVGAASTPDSLSLTHRFPSTTNSSLAAIVGDNDLVTPLANDNAADDAILSSWLHGTCSDAGTVPQAPATDDGGKKTRKGKKLTSAPAAAPTPPPHKIDLAGLLTTTARLALEAAQQEVSALVARQERYGRFLLHYVDPAVAGAGLDEVFEMQLEDGRVQRWVVVQGRRRFVATDRRGRVLCFLGDEEGEEGEEGYEGGERVFEGEFGDVGEGEMDDDGDVKMEG